MEEFRTVPSYEGLYYVSATGRIRNRHGRLMKPQFNNRGYLYIGAVKNGTRRKLFIHRAVALSYIDNPLNRNLVDHIDRNKTNNHISNLRWVTLCENQSNRICTGVTTIQIGERTVYEVRLSKNKVRYHKGYYDNKEVAINKYRTSHVELHGEISPYYNTIAAL